MHLINTKRLGFLQKFWLPAFSPISLSPHHSLFISPSFSTSLNPFLTLSLPSLLLFHPSVSSYLPSLSLPLHLPTLPLPQILTPFLSISLSLPISSLSHPLPFPFLSPYSALHSLSLSLIPFSLSFKLTIPITQKWQTDLTYLCESVDPSLVPGIRCPMVGNLYTVTIAPPNPQPDWEVVFLPIGSNLATGLLLAGPTSPSASNDLFVSSSLRPLLYSPLVYFIPLSGCLSKIDAW